MKYKTFEIPFVTIENRRALTGLQIVQMPLLRDFVETFRRYFVYVPNYDAVFYIGPNDKEIQ
jgi:hypothetical protein